MKNHSDSQLIADYRQGHRESLEILFSRYLKPIYSFVYRFVGNSLEAEDLTQEVFLRVWRSLNQFKLDKSFKTWIFSLAKNVCLDFLKKKREVLFSDLETEEGESFFAETLIDPSPLPPKVLENMETKQLLNDILKELSPQERMILFLRYNDHFSFREIAETLEMSLNTVTSCHRRALLKLRRKIIHQQDLKLTN